MVDADAAHEESRNKLTRMRDAQKKNKKKKKKTGQRKSGKKKFTGKKIQAISASDAAFSNTDLMIEAPTIPSIHPWLLMFDLGYKHFRSTEFSRDRVGRRTGLMVFNM